MHDETAPVFYCEAIAHIGPSGPNSVLSFVVTVPSADGTQQTMKVNLRVVIPHHALKQGLGFLAGAIENQPVVVQPPPGAVQ